MFALYDYLIIIITLKQSYAQTAITMLNPCLVIAKVTARIDETILIKGTWIVLHKNLIAKVTATLNETILIKGTWIVLHKNLIAKVTARIDETILIKGT